MKTDNEFIAEFMGLKENAQGYWTIPDYHLKGGESFKLLYDTSWDWLMPVVEKIESLGFKVAIELNGCTIFKDYGAPVTTTGNWDTKINAVYKAVCGFIPWHNSLKK